MKEQCQVCGSTVDDVSGVCPVCGAVLISHQTMAGVDPYKPEDGNGQPGTDAAVNGTAQPDSSAQPGGYGVPNGAAQPDGYGMPNGAAQPGNTAQPGGYIVPNGAAQPGNTVQPGGYGAPNGTVQPGGYVAPNNMPQYQQPYNYQNPNAGNQVTNSGAPKQKLFSIISLICSLVSFLTCCIPWLGLILGIAAIVFAIIALIKKQSKVPAVIGLIIGIIGTLAAIGTLSFNLIMKSTTGTSFGGLMKQLIEVQSTGVTELEDIIFLNPADNEYYALYSDGTYETSDYDYGDYENYSYMDYYNTYSSSDAVTYGVIYAMNQGYQVKDVTILDFPDASYMFIVPSDFKPGDTIYYVDYPTSYTDLNGYKLIEVTTQSVSSYY